MVQYNNPYEWERSYPSRDYRSVVHEGYFLRGPYDYRKTREMLLERKDVPVAGLGIEPLADHVFGRQIRMAGLDRERLQGLLYERVKLHYQHVKDINHRHMKCQEELFGVKLTCPGGDSRRWSNLETALSQLETEKRREELMLWKDTAEIRKAMFDSTSEYEKAWERADLLGSLLPGALGGKYE